MSESKQIKSNRCLVLEVENHRINKRSEIFRRELGTVDMLDGLDYTGEWEGREIKVRFQHLDNSNLTAAIWEDGAMKLMLVCKACNEHGITIATALAGDETLNIRVDGAD